MIAKACFPIGVTQHMGCDFAAYYVGVASKPCAALHKSIQIRRREGNTNPPYDEADPSAIAVLPLGQKVFFTLSGGMLSH